MQNRGIRPKVAVICGNKFEDGLVMMVASHRLFCQECDVTTYHHRLPQLAQWFENHQIRTFPPLESFAEHFGMYDLIIMQSCHLPRYTLLQRLFTEGIVKKLAIFYPSYDAAKDAALSPWDRIFHANLSLVDNISKAIASLLEDRYFSKNNGIRAPNALTHRKERRRVLVRLPKVLLKRLSWTFDQIRSLGFEITFIHESLKELPVHSLAEEIYQSGFIISNRPLDFHLSSNLQIPTLIIAQATRTKLVTGWLKSAVLIRSFFDRFTLQRRLLNAFKLLSRHA